MRESQSTVDSNLFLLEDAEAFVKHAGELATHARREIVILSEFLDPVIFDQADFSGQVSRLARQDRHARVRVLVKDIQPLVDRGHRLLTLARRLSSKVEVRKLLIAPENGTQAYLIADREQLLYRHDERKYSGFASYKGGFEAKSLMGEFNHLWERHSELSPALRTLRI